MLKRAIHRIPPPIRFVILFLAGLGILAIVYPYFSTRFQAQMVGFMSATAWVVAHGLRLFGMDITLSGRFVHASNFSVEIIEECTGAYEIVIFWAAVLAYPARWRAKLIGVIGGTLAMLAINIIRMMFIVAVSNRWPQAFHFLHIYFWQATLILMIVTVWILWIKLVANPRESATA
jgi:archaeosortase B (VPXXXP-CTERM-specific)